ncbi:MAG: hypothetical protein ACK4NF_05250 [Planctomycetota bacterium]
MKKLLIFLIICIAMVMPQDETKEKLKKLEEQIQALQKEYENKIFQLQQQLRQLQEKLEEKEIEQESLSVEFAKEKEESRNFRKQLSRVSYLPDISVIGDVRFRTGNNVSDENFFINEIEFAISGAVDPYFYYDSFITLEREETGEMHFHPEEAHVKYLGVKNLGLRIGRFLLPITKSNTWHTHQRLFGEVPLYYEYLSGEEGFKTDGLHIYYQIDKPITELSFYLGTATNSKIFRDETSQILPLISIKNLFPFSELSDIETITTFAYGGNQFGKHTFLAANTLFFRAKNNNYPYNKIQILTENIFARVKGVEDEEKFANYILLSYNFNKYLAVGFDFSIAKVIDGSNYETAYGVIFDIIPTEFSFLRFNYQRNPQTNEGIFLIELNFGIGKHRAHTY